MNLWLEFLGYYVTEGGIETKPTIGIVQKKGSSAKKIKKCLKKLTKILGCTLTEIDCDKYVRLKITQTQLYKYLKHLGHKSYDKKLCIDFSKLSKEQIKILYSAMMLGDGSSKGKDFGSTSKNLIDDFQAIACLTGKSACKSIQYKAGTRGKIAIQGNTLKAETSVLAAANPKFGRFDPYQSIAQQIDLPPTLINRFDIIFTLRDIPNKEKDELIATHVLSEHQREGEEMEIILFSPPVQF